MTKKKRGRQLKSIPKQVAKANNTSPNIVATSQNNPDAQKTWFRTLTNIFNKFWLLITAIISLTGFTVFSVLPGIDFSLKNTADQNLLIVELKNRSFLGITDINPVLYIHKLYTTEGDSVTRMQMVNHNRIPKKIGGNQKYVIDYSFNEMFFMYNHRPQFLEAKMALEIEYKFLFFTCRDNYFIECRPDYHGDFIWLETQEEDYLDNMKSDTTKPNLDDLPYMKRLYNDKRIQHVPVPPLPSEH